MILQEVHMTYKDYMHWTHCVNDIFNVICNEHMKDWDFSKTSEEENLLGAAAPVEPA